MEKVRSRLGLGLVALLAWAGCSTAGVGTEDAAPVDASESDGEAPTPTPARPQQGEGDTGTVMGTSSSPEAPSTGTDSPPDDDSPDDAQPFCGDGTLDPLEACDDGNANDFDGCRSDCTEVPLLDVPADEWTYVEVPGTTCLDGSVGGFGVNPNPQSDALMIYLEGGGACFNDACDFTAFELPFIGPRDGIFRRGSAGNPVRDWNMIYVPYCTGDLHAGDNEVELGGRMRAFRGYSNLTRYLERIVPSFNAQRVLLTGISAGGFGAALNAGQAAEAFGPSVELTVVGDSGAPLSNAVMPPCLQQAYRETWALDHTVLADCPTCDPNNFATTLFADLLRRYPNMRYGLFSYTRDGIIRGFMGAGWGNGRLDNCGGVPVAVPGGVFRDDLLEIRRTHEDRISTMFVFGPGHTALRIGYTAVRTQGVSVRSWLGRVVEGERLHLGQR